MAVRRKGQNKRKPKTKARATAKLPALNITPDSEVCWQCGAYVLRDPDGTLFDGRVASSQDQGLCSTCADLQATSAKEEDDMRTRKDFKAAAALIASMAEPTRSERALEAASGYAKENARFDRRVFLAACDSDLCDGPMWMRIIPDGEPYSSKAEAMTRRPTPPPSPLHYETIYRISCMTCGAHQSDQRNPLEAIQALSARTRHVRYRGTLVFSSADAAETGMGKSSAVKKRSPGPGE